MNHPGRDVIDEITWMAEMGIEFVDLTLEPPRATVTNVDIKAIKNALEKHELPVVGHTAYYLPLASPFESLRRAAADEVKRCIEAFSKLGASWVNIHPDRSVLMLERKYIIERNIRTINELLPVAREWNVGVMVENIPGHFNTAEQLGELLDPFPEVGLHLDIGHCNLLTEFNTTEEILKAYGKRLRHVHLHDNKGGNADLHLPLGTGSVDLPRCLRAVRATGYDGTITLEVFSPDRRHLAFSRDVLKEVWATVAPPPGVVEAATR